MKQALIKITTAWRCFERVCKGLGGKPRDVAARNLNAINAVTVFDLSSTSSILCVNLNLIVNYLTNVSLTNRTATNSFSCHFQSVSGVDNNDIDEDTSVSTDNADYSICNAVHAVCQHSLHNSPGRSLDFWFEQR